MQTLLPGLRAALNYHPIFVHFPIVLWLAALLFELLAVWRASEDMHRTAVRMLYLATLAAGVALLSGFGARDSVPPGPAQEAVELHQLIMVAASSISLGLCLFAFLARKNFTAKLRKLMLLGLAILAALITLGADRGAQLVYQYGAGVNWPAAQQQGETQQPK